MSQLPWLGVIGSILSPLVFAATQSLVISGTPASLDENAEAEITVNLTCTSCSTDSYLRGVFYPSGTSYFGYTQSNDGTWTNAPGASCTQYYKVLTTDLSSEGTWSGKLKVKPDPASSYYNGPGEYLFKVGRYTPSCSSASTWSNEVTIALTGPTHTPTPSVTPTSNPTSAPTTTPQPTQTTAPTATVMPSKTPTPTRKPTVTLEPNEPTISDILGTQEIATEVGRVNEPRPLVFSLLFIGTGLGLIATVLAWQKTDVWKKMLEKDKKA